MPPATEQSDCRRGRRRKTMPPVSSQSLRAQQRMLEIAKTLIYVAGFCSLIVLVYWIVVLVHILTH